jgi:hypothetical protein
VHIDWRAKRPRVRTPSRASHKVANLLKQRRDLLIYLLATAAAGRHHAKSQHVIVRPSQAVIPSYATPGGVRIYRDDSVPGGLRTYHDDPPAYDDPSKFGSG